MKFRTKLFYSFITLGLLSSFLALFIIYGEASHLVFEEIRSKTLSLVTNSVHFVDAAALEKFIDSKGDMNSPQYHELRKELLGVRDINRRTDVYVKNIYILYQVPDSDLYYFALDGQRKSEPIAKFGDTFPPYIETPPNPKQSYVTQDIYSDPLGTWITGYAPIVNRDGKEIALLGIDVRTREIYRQLEKLLLYGLIAFGIAIFVGSIFAYFLSRYVTSSLTVLSDTIEKIGAGDFSARSTLKRHDEFNSLSVAINTMAQGLQERDRLKMGFARYVSQYAMEELLKIDKPISLEGERKKVTILFSDIRQFTTISENLAPEEVLKLLNEYLGLMIEVIFNYGGTLDKFIGDGLMVEFGAPLEDKHQELHAVLAAIHMQQELDRLSDRWEKEGKPRLSMGIGIHTGLAVLGNIGSEKRMEYTAIGDTVNIASRLERLTKPTEKAIIISESVHDMVKDHFTFEDLDEVTLPGRTGTTKAYAIDPHAQENLHQIELSHEMRHHPHTDHE